MIGTLSVIASTATSTAGSTGDLSMTTTIAAIAGMVVLAIAWFLLNRNTGSD